MTPAAEPEDYLAERVRQTIVNDPRVLEFSIRVTVVGQKIFVRGPVSTDERREAVGTIVRETFPGYELANETTVVTPTEPDGAEEIT